jgi:signal transduction histidine kinase
VRTQNLGELLSGNIQERWRQFSWGEVFAPVIFENRLHGILILGKRVAGNIYSDQDVNIIATVTQQGALATVNVQLVETLRGLSQQLVRADENERKQVARELHDGVLQNLFFIRQKVRQNPELVGYLEDIITTLRRTIKAQRPSELDRGLAPALEDLIRDMKKLVGANGPKIVWRSTAGDIHLPDEQATAIYRIAQESVSNAVRHAQAQNIAVSLSRDEGVLVLAIEDDGVGMPKTRASEGQYGLIGMRERAIMIGADLHTQSNLGEGTRIVMEYKLC